MIDFVSFLPAHRKATSSGWISFCAPCCTHRGETPDKKMRGGFMSNPDNSWSYHCFNCGFTASYTPGRQLSFKARSLLTWLGVDSQVLEHINLESLRHKSIHGLLEESRVIKKIEIDFEEKDLPANLELVDKDSDKIHYLLSRGVPKDYPIMTNASYPRPNVVIPFTYNNMIVGSSTRYLDDRAPKYINDIQHGYVFGTDLQHKEWKYAIVVEGVFDALSISGLAVLHNDINPAQIELIKSLNKEIIVVPDMDKAGMKLIQRAVELGWSVSIPNWPEGVKDVNDAVIQLGKLGTILTILEAKESSKIKIELKRKQLAKRLRA